MIFSLTPNSLSGYALHRRMKQFIGDSRKPLRFGKTSIISIQMQMFKYEFPNEKIRFKPANTIPAFFITYNDSIARGRTVDIMDTIHSGISYHSSASIIQTYRKPIIERIVLCSCLYPITAILH